MLLKIRDRVTIWGVVLLLCLLVLSLGCGNAAHIVQPPDDVDTVVTIITGPPAYGISTPQALTLVVGEKQKWPTTIVYDSTDTVITDVELGWKLWKLDVLRFTYNTGGFDSVWATAELGLGEAYPLASWQKDYSVFYNLNNGGKAKITVTAINK